jgi:hypothetical protein
MPEKMKQGREEEEKEDGDEEGEEDGSVMKEVVVANLALCGLIICSAKIYYLGGHWLRDLVCRRSSRKVSIYVIPQNTSFNGNEFRNGVNDWPRICAHISGVTK